MRREARGYTMKTSQYITPRVRALFYQDPVTKSLPSMKSSGWPRQRNALPPPCPLKPTIAAPKSDRLHMLRTSQTGWPENSGLLQDMSRSADYLLSRFGWLMACTGGIPRSWEVGLDQPWQIVLMIHSPPGHAGC